MKARILTGIVGLITLSVVSLTRIYPKSFLVVDIEDDLVTIMDYDGYEWEMYGAEDFEVGDRIACIMHDNGTPDNMFDDYILKVQYEGVEE